MALSKLSTADLHYHDCHRSIAQASSSSLPIDDVSTSRLAVMLQKSLVRIDGIFQSCCDSPLRHYHNYYFYLIFLPPSSSSSPSSPQLLPTQFNTYNFYFTSLPLTFTRNFHHHHCRDRCCYYRYDYDHDHDDCCGQIFHYHFDVHRFYHRFKLFDKNFFTAYFWRTMLMMIMMKIYTNCYIDCIDYFASIFFCSLVFELQRAVVEVVVATAAATAPAVISMAMILRLQHLSAKCELSKFAFLFESISSSPLALLLLLLLSSTSTSTSITYFANAYCSTASDTKSRHTTFFANQIVNLYALSRNAFKCKPLYRIASTFDEQNERNNETQTYLNCCDGGVGGGPVNHKKIKNLNLICKYLPNTSDRSDFGETSINVDNVGEDRFHHLSHRCDDKLRSTTKTTTAFANVLLHEDHISSPQLRSTTAEKPSPPFSPTMTTKSTTTAKYQIYRSDVNIFSLLLPTQKPDKTIAATATVTAVKQFSTQLIFLFVIFISQLSTVQSSANIRAIEKQILDKIIGGHYDSRIRPMGSASNGTRSGDGPAMVYVNLLIRSISRIDDVVMEYSVQVTFRQQWVDNRLKFDSMGGQIRYLVLTDPTKVWRPDLFFKNEKEGHFHEIILPNVLLRIHPQGEVLYSIRISLVLACPMNLKYYPLDKQICSIQMASYGYTTEDLMFVWKQEDPVQITTNLHLPRFTLEKYLTDYCTSTTNTGSYSCLKVDLLFKREFSYYLIQIYIPCCMLVIVSWVSFWLDPNAIPARVSLGVTTLLTMATSISGINSSLPPVSYTKAIDVWTGVCLTFVFGALLEFALVNYASRSDAHRAALKQQQVAFAAQRKWDLEHAAALEADRIDDRSGSAFAMRPLVRQHGDFHGEKMRACEVHVTLPKRNWCKRWLSKFPTRSKRIDVISRIFFPLMFALFNLVYWTTYLFREDMQDLLN